MQKWDALWRQSCAADVSQPRNINVCIRFGQKVQEKRYTCRTRFAGSFGVRHKLFHANCEANCVRSPLLVHAAQLVGAFGWNPEDHLVGRLDRQQFVV